MQNCNGLNNAELLPLADLLTKRHHARLISEHTFAISGGMVLSMGESMPA